MPFAHRAAYCLILSLWLTANSGWAGDSDKPSVSVPSKISIQVTGMWKRVDSANFRCWCQFTDDDARLLTESCEAWRARLRQTWITDPADGDWQPKCEIVVHPHRTAYNRALNRPADTSVGSTQMKFDQGRTVLRRIDVRADASDWSNAALPHELTHVVLGERFGGKTLPRWADEGMAMLSESSEKHRERLVNLRTILAGRPSFSIQDLMQTHLLPEPHRRDAFYGQSLALSSLLIRKSTPAQFADFVEDARLLGDDEALQKHYQVDGISALQQEWNAWVRRSHTLSFVSLPIQIDSDPKFAVVETP